MCVMSKRVIRYSLSANQTCKILRSMVVQKEVVNFNNQVALQCLQIITKLIFLFMFNSFKKFLKYLSKENPR